MEKVYSTEKITAENRIDILYKVRDNIDVIGWELVDDRIATNDQVVFKSTGNDADIAPCYLGIYFCVNEIRFIHGVYYSFDTKQFFNRFYYSISHAPFNSGIIYCDENSYNEIILKGNKDFIYLEVFRPSNSSTSSGIVFRIDNLFWENKIGFTQEDTNIVADVEVQLGPGQASYFKTGATYRIVSPVGHVAKSTVTGLVDTVNDKVTFDSIPYTLASGTRIGPAPFPWVCVGKSGHINYDIQFMKWSVGSIYATGATNSVISCHSSFGYTGSTDVYNSSETFLTPLLFNDTSGGNLGYSSYIYLCGYGSFKDIIGVNSICTGFVGSSTVSGVVDNLHSWENDELKDMGIIITSGSQEFTTRRIVSNTATTIYVDPPFPGPIEASETFSVCESFYRKTPSFPQLGNFYLKNI